MESEFAQIAWYKSVTDSKRREAQHKQEFVGSPENLLLFQLCSNIYVGVKSLATIRGMGFAANLQQSASAGLIFLTAKTAKMSSTAQLFI